MQNKILLGVVLIATVVVTGITLFLHSSDDVSGATPSDTVSSNNIEDDVIVTTVEQPVVLASDNVKDVITTVNTPIDKLTLQLANAINYERVAAGLKPLSFVTNCPLEDAALIRAEEASICWSHTRPDGSDWYTVNPDIMHGENLACGYSTCEATMTAWMNSPTHKYNILTPDFNFMAIGVYDLDGQYFVALEFSC